MSSLDYLDLCRLCLVKDRVSVPIFEGEGDVRQIFLKIAACLPVKVAREDKLPKKICDDCVYKVELLYQFWNTTASAEKQLLQWLGDVSLDDKQGYVTGAHNQNLMKSGQNPVENRLDGSVMQQVNDHPNSMGMGMMDSMGMGMPMMITTSGQQQQSQQQQQMTSVPMDTGGNSVQNVQAVPGPSTQSTHEQIAQQKVINQSSNPEDDEDESEEDDNSDDECDGDDGLPVKEESEEDPNSSRTIEPTTFVNVSLACDEAGPSGLQQQKIGEMPEMVMPTTDGDPKSGANEKMDVSIGEHRGMFIFDRESVVMRKWQILEFDGKPYYAFVPENDDPIDASEIPEVGEVSSMKNETYEDGSIYENEESLYNYECDEQSELSHEDDDEGEVENDESVARETKPVLLNGAEKDQENQNPPGDLYQVKVEGSTVTLERLTENVAASEEPKTSSSSIKQEPAEEISEYDVNETLMEIPEDEEDVEEEQEVDQEEQVAEASEEKIIEDYENDDEDEDDPYEQEEFEEKPTQPSSKGTMTKPPIPQRIAQLSGRSSSIAKTVGGPLKCKACSETFGSAIAFRKHVAWTHKKKVCIQEDGAYICAVCDYRTLKKSLFAAHLERKHETWARKREVSMVFPCEVCGFACRSKHSLQSHFIRKHTDTYEHSCQFCDKKFKVKGDLTNHVRFHHKEKPINCDVCGKLCQNTGSLYVHQKWAHYKPKFECHICRRRMVTQENLDQHLITQHEQREKIVCAQCGKTFTKKDSFKRHMAVHTGSKPHPCPICTKPFARQSQLRQHVLIHTGQRPFVCDICGKGFTQKPGLICHRKTHPGPLPPLPVMPIADLVREFIAQNEESQSQDHDLESINDDTDDRAIRWGALGEGGEVAQ